MDLEKLKSISEKSYDIALTKSNALKKAQSDIVTVYQNHIFLANAETICLAKTLAESNSSFFVLDTNSNPVEILDPEEFIEILIQKNQSAINTFHQLYQKIKSKEF